MIFNYQYIFIKFQKINLILFKYINLHLGIFSLLQYISLAFHYIFGFEIFILYFSIIFLYNIIQNIIAINKINKKILNLKSTIQNLNSLNEKKFDHIKKKYSNIYKELIFIGVLYIIFAAIFILLKFSINEIRPICATNNYYSIIEFGFERCESSFPSAHTGMITLYVFFALKYIFLKYNNFILKIILCICGLVFIGIVGISRIILALHYPFDVLSGFIITYFVIWVGIKFKNTILYKTVEKAFIFILEKIIYFKR
ncbi:MAG: phosphatase PAP2 family protein [Rickettsiales bacterium]